MTLAVLTSQMLLSGFLKYTTSSAGHSGMIVSAANKPMRFLRHIGWKQLLGAGMVLRSEISRFAMPLGWCRTLSLTVPAQRVNAGFQAPIGYDTPVAKDQVDVEDPKAMSAEIKKIASFFGADLCGVTDFDERWLYESRVDVRDFSDAPHDLPEGLTSVIVLGHEMQEDLVATYPSALAGAATRREYSHEAAIVMQVAAYIRNLGYEAVPSMNDTALVIPYAIKAGLGEYSRNQLVITPEFGPRLRFSKIFTNLPLAHDRPAPLGVKAFCYICTKCADACPVKA